MAYLLGAWRPWLVVVALSLTAVSMAPGNAEASVVYQSIPDLAVAPFSSFCSQCSGSGGQQIGQFFSIGGPASIGSATFTVSNYFSGRHPVTLTVYQDLGGTLGAQVYNQTFATFVSDVNIGNLTDIVRVNTSA